MPKKAQIPGGLGDSGLLKRHQSFNKSYRDSLSKKMMSTCRARVSALGISGANTNNTQTGSTVTSLSSRARNGFDLGTGIGSGSGTVVKCLYSNKTKVNLDTKRTTSGGIRSHHGHGHAHHSSITKIKKYNHAGD